MWNQWPQYAAPPLPTAAPPPPPQEPAGGTTPAAHPIIGPMLPSSVAPAAFTTPTLPTPSTPPVAVGAIPAALGANPYSQYTAAQYAAMTPEQQYAVQQHWQQWQKYQEEYARWHAQYGEQYKREMELAQNNNKINQPTPTVAAAPAYPSYYPQPPPSAPNSKITGQPQLYNQPPPPQVPAINTNTLNPINCPSGTVPMIQQPQWQPSTFNQPPPGFNHQKSNTDNSPSPMNTQKFQQPHFGGGKQQGSPAVPSNQSNIENNQYNNRNENSNRGLNTPGGVNSWQGPPAKGPDNFNNNNSGSNDRTNNSWTTPNADDGNIPPNSWNSNDGGANRNLAYSNSGDGKPNKKENMTAKGDISVDNNQGDVDEFNNNWNSGENYQGYTDDNSRNRGQSNWNKGGNEVSFGQNSRGSNNYRVPNNWNDHLNNRAKNERKVGSKNQGQNNWNQGSNNSEFNNRNDDENNRGTNNWNGGSINRGSGNWSDRGTNNRNENTNNRDQNDWNDNCVSNDRNFGSNNRGPNNWNDNANSVTNDRNFGQTNLRNSRPNNVNERDMRRSDNWGNQRQNISCGPPTSGSDVSSCPGTSSGIGASGPANRVHITDLDEEMFDRQFRQWEQQFEDWKNANANHPDKTMYNRYEQEFEKQRKRITERREQMRRRKLEQMGLDPIHPPLKPSLDRQRIEITDNEKADNPEYIVRRRNDSIGSHQSSGAKQNQEKITEVKLTDSQESESEPFEKNVSGEPSKDNSNQCDVVNKQNDEIAETTTIDDTSQLNKNTAVSLGKRKSRFDPSKTTTKFKAVETSDVITLDDDDEAVEKQSEDNQGSMSEIFKKVDGIPGLDLADESSSVPTTKSAKDELETDTLKANMKPEKNKLQKNQVIATAPLKKIPSLFDIKVDKPDMTDLSNVKEQAGSPTSSAALPELAKTLNDPDFLKRISEAVAHVKSSDTSNTQEVDGGQLSFSEWQNRKQSDEAENKPTDYNVEINKNPNCLEIGDDLNSNLNVSSGSIGNICARGLPNSMGINNNMFGPNNNFGPNGNNDNSNWAPNGPNNWGPNGPNNWGTNGSTCRDFGRYGSNNNFGPNGPNNNFGPNGPNNNFGPNGPNNNFGPNGRNNFGPNSSNNNFCPNGPNNNFGPNGPNNNFARDGTNHWCPNGPNNWAPNGHNNNFGPNGPNNNFGPGGPNNHFGNNGQNNWGSNGPNNWCRNDSHDFGSNNNFRGGNNFGPNRNFGGNGNNDGAGRNFGRNDGQGRNFGRNGPNFGANDGFNHNFGPNNNGGRNFTRDGPNFGSDSADFNRDDRDDNRHSRGRGGSNDRRDGSNNRRNSFNNKRDGSNNKSSTSKDENNSNDAIAPNRNINNPFRRNIGGKITGIGEDISNKTKGNDDCWIKSPDDRDNIDYGDYYRPVQVIDYSNSNATPTTTITPRVIDYGHKPAMSDDTNAFKPLKIINYDHASKARNTQQQMRLNATPKRRKRKNKNNSRQQKKANQNQLQSEQHQQKQTQLAQSNTTGSKEQKDLQEQNKVAHAEKAEDELEEISDVEDMGEEPESPPPPPPPLFNSSGSFTSFASQVAPSSIFPSTSEANENLPKVSSAHVQMSIPTEENNNTISIDEILMKPGRQTRPKRICMILRGPPGSGKSHVAKLIKEKEKEMGGNNPRILSIDDYFLIENDYEEKCPKTGKKIPKKEILYEYDKDMEEKYMEYLIKGFKKSVADNFYDFIVIDCNNNSLRSLNEFYCHSKDSGFVPYIIDLFCDLKTCLERNIHERSEHDIKEIIDTWKPTPGHYIKLDISSLLENIVEMEDAEDMVVDDNAVSECGVDDNNLVTDNDQTELDDQKDDHAVDAANDAVKEGNVFIIDEDDSNDSIEKCGFLKSKWETDTTTENLARLDGTSKLSTKRKPTMEEYLQMDEWQPPTDSKGKKRVRWADIEEKLKQDKMRAVGFVVGQTDWKRMMDPYAAKRALNKTKYIERVNKRR